MNRYQEQERDVVDAHERGVISSIGRVLAQIPKRQKFSLVV
jgi:hypothetical protein